MRVKLCADSIACAQTRRETCSWYVFEQLVLKLLDAFLRSSILAVNVW